MIDCKLGKSCRCVSEPSLCPNWAPVIRPAGGLATESKHLRPCPFCGNPEPKLHSNGMGDFYVRCEAEDEDVHCGARTSDRDCETITAAVRRWNDRAQAPKSSGENYRRKSEEVLAWQYTGQAGAQAPQWITKIVRFPFPSLVKGHWLVLANGRISQWSEEGFAEEFERVGSNSAAQKEDRA